VAASSEPSHFFLPVGLSLSGVLTDWYTRRRRSQHLNSCGPLVEVVVRDSVGTRLAPASASKRAMSRL
jgi:hypothetical protein